jgi:hypothetical protein
MGDEKIEIRRLEHNDLHGRVKQIGTVETRGSKYLWDKSVGSPHDWADAASRSVISAPNSTIVVGPNMLIGGLLKVIVHRPG